MPSIISNSSFIFSFSLKNFLILLNKIRKFFKDENNIKELLEIVEGKTKLSLRIIDWFVTNYSKKNLIIIHNKKKQIVLRMRLDARIKKAKSILYKSLLDSFSRVVYG